MGYEKALELFPLFETKLLLPLGPSVIPELKCVQIMAKFEVAALNKTFGTGTRAITGLKMSHCPHHVSTCWPRD